MNRFIWYKKALSALGPLNLIKLQLRMTTGSPDLDHPVGIRKKTSDKEVFNQIFVEREYRCLDGLGDLPFILDCGANVGYSASYLLSQFKHSTVFAIEPDADNFIQLKRNIAPYGNRVSCLRAAVWDRRTKLQFQRSTVGVGDEWGRRMEEGSGEVEAYDIPAILRESGFPRISLLKMDVEGAETQIFGSNSESWLPLVDNIVIELHGAEAERTFHRAIAPYEFKISRCEELTLCRKS